MPEIDSIFERSQSIPDHDVHASLLSLPYILKTSPDSIPSSIPYLSTQSEHPYNEICPDKNMINVGIVWAGNPKHNNDRNRSTSPAFFKLLFDVYGINWFSLQVGEQSNALSTIPGLEFVEDTSRLLIDFAATASVIQQLDLVITVDTSVAHLAGALACRTWVLLPYIPDWRWMLERDDSPWYPTMRLFRQQNGHDWSSVFNEIHQALEELVMEHHSGN